MNFFAIMMFAMALDSKIKEPDYTILQKEKNIEIREYSEYVIARTSVIKDENRSDNGMFMILANYIFGGNKKKESIAMTAPVITKENDESYDMVFFMLDVDEVDELPNPDSKNVHLERMNLGKTVAIRFGWWATRWNIERNRRILERYIEENDLEVVSEMMVAQYNSPWDWPFLRRNDVIFQIK